MKFFEVLPLLEAGERFCREGWDRDRGSSLRFRDGELWLVDDAGERGLVERRNPACLGYEDIAADDWVPLPLRPWTERTELRP